MKQAFFFSQGDLFIFYIFLGPLFEKFLNLMSAKKVAQLNSHETSKYLQLLIRNVRIFSF